MSKIVVSKKWQMYGTKYSCEHKDREEKLQDLLKAARDGKTDIVNMLVKTGGVNVNEIPEEEKNCQG